MSGFVRCLCGMPIDQVYPVFAELQAEQMAEVLKQNNTIPSKASANLNIKVDCQEIFKLLKINNMCCRMHITSAFNFHDMLN